MSISGRSLWQLQLFSIVMLIVPMIVYPNMLGTDLQKFAPTYLLYELLFYIVVTFVLYRQVTFFQAIQISGVCLIYRLILACLFSFLLAAVHSMSVNVSFALGMYSYLPALLLHIVATPLMLKPVLDGVYSESFKGRVVRTVETPTAEIRDTGATSVAYSKERKTSRPATRSMHTPVMSKRTADQGSRENQYTNTDSNGFDKATKYVGEDGSVRLVAVIDREGLLLSNFTRGGLVAEDVAPYTLSIMKTCADKMAKIEYGSPERIDFMLKDERIVLATEKYCSLMVIAERRSDDLLNIRINQAIEMIRKYMSERYSQKLHPTMEKSYA